jgi:hypothetical protein
MTGRMPAPPQNAVAFLSIVRFRDRPSCSGGLRRLQSIIYNEFCLPASGARAAAAAGTETSGWRHALSVFSTGEITIVRTAVDFVEGPAPW